MWGELQVLVAEIGNQAREVEQLVIVVERRGIQCDLHVSGSLDGVARDHFDGDRLSGLQ